MRSSINLPFFLTERRHNIRVPIPPSAPPRIAMAQTESRQIRPVQTESHCNIRIAAQHPLTRTATSVLKLAPCGRGRLSAEGTKPGEGSTSQGFSKIEKRIIAKRTPHPPSLATARAGTLSLKGRGEHRPSRVIVHQREG